MIPKDWNEYNLLLYEKRWYEQLKTIEPGQLRLIIDHNNVLNQSASFKYSTVIKFITVLMGYNSERQALAIQMIDKYWSKLEKSELLSNLLKHAPFEIFQKYFNKARLKPEQTAWFIVSVLKHDNFEEAAWVINNKKFDKWLDEKNVGFIDAMLENRLKNALPEVVDLFVSKEELVIIAVEKGYDNLIPKTLKELFLF